MTVVKDTPMCDRAKAVDQSDVSRSSTRCRLAPALRPRLLPNRLAAVLWTSCALLSTHVLAHGDRGEHLQDLDKRIAEAPTNVELWIERATVHRRQGHLDEALSDLHRVRSLSPNRRDVLYLLGLTLLDNGQITEAESTLQQYLKAFPNSPLGHSAHATALSRQTRHLDAAEAYGRAIANQPSPVPDYYIAQAREFLAAGEEHFDESLAALDKGISTVGPLIVFQQLAIEIEAGRGETGNALDRINSILIQVERKERWLFKKGEVLAEAGQTLAARAAFESANNAVSLLPIRIRNTPAMKELKRRIHENLNDFSK